MAEKPKSKWSQGSDQERLEAFKARLASADVTPAYYRTGDLGVDARMESGCEYRAASALAPGQCACGRSNQPNTKFCENCGASLERKAPPVAAANGCKHCGSHLVPDARFCTGCGQSVVAVPLKCSGCGAQRPPAAKFCAQCGNKHD